MTRVRKLYQATCTEILQRRSAALESQSDYKTIGEYNRCVNALQSEQGKEWCEENALIPLESGFRFSVVMPVYNEAATITQMIERVCKLQLPLELIVVDDGSDDGTADVLREWESRSSLPNNSFGKVQLRFLFHSQNEGKGAALKTGFKATTGDIVAIQDADQEYDPQEFTALVSSILLDEADVVYGSRFAKGTDSNSPGWHRFGNGLITWFSNLMTGLSVTDAETCYKLMRKPLLDELVDGLQEKRFGIELEMTAKLARNKKIRFDERPISYHKRTYAEGKKIGIRDGFRALWCILKY